MRLNKRVFCFIYLWVVFVSFGQETQQPTDSSALQLVEIPFDEVHESNIYHNDSVWFFSERLLPLLQKFQNLEKHNEAVISFLHIGDSHIQADFFTGFLRRQLQEKFGNAGRGFVFPHQLVKSNGTFDVKFTSPQSWSGRRLANFDIHPSMGIGGFLMFLQNKDSAVLSWRMTDEQDAFTRVKVFDPMRSLEVFWIEGEQVDTKSHQVQVKKHTIRNGESLSVIAQKYNVKIKDLQKVNNLKSSAIRAGKQLIIPSDFPKSQSEFKIINKINFNRNHEVLRYETELSQHGSLLVSSVKDSLQWHGFSLENNNSGIRFHTIGVNGAKYTDYLKYPKLITQWKALEPDVLLVSLGTNESFDRMKIEDFRKSVQQFVDRVKSEFSETVVILTTPPPSLFKRKYINVLLPQYVEVLKTVAYENDIVVWDLYSRIIKEGGMPRLIREGEISADRIHYSKKGYEVQGRYLIDDLLKVYSHFLNSDSGEPK